MKRLFVFFILISIILSGCAAETEKIEKPVKFYYPVNVIEFNTDAGVIAHEIRESSGFQNTEELLLDYLEGPLSDQLHTPFSAGTDLVSLETVNSICTVVLSEEFAELSGLDLTIACHSLGMTIFELTSVGTVIIKAMNAELDGQKSVTVSRNSFLLMDSSTGETVDPAKIGG